MLRMTIDKFRELAEVPYVIERCSFYDFEKQGSGGCIFHTLSLTSKNNDNWSIFIDEEDEIMENGVDLEDIFNVRVLCEAEFDDYTEYISELMPYDLIEVFAYISITVGQSEAK